MWKPKNSPGESGWKAVNCPVCKTFLGRRDGDSVFAGYCEECRCMFYWKPKAIKPTVTMDKDKPEGCGCGGCGR